MAENKTKATDASVAPYLAAIDDEARGRPALPGNALLARLCLAGAQEER
jgi:hypothetical protein